jgi:hypothetical protein
MNTGLSKADAVDSFKRYLFYIHKVNEKVMN